MLRDPDIECAGCLRRISAPNVWLCDLCVSRALQAGFEATPFHHPGNDCTEYLWNKSLEEQRAKTEKRSDGSEQSHGEESA